MTARASISSPLLSTTPVATPSFTLTLSDFYIRANLDASSLRGNGHGGRECARATHDVSRSARGIAIGGSAQQQGRARPCRPRTEERAEDALRGDGGAQQFGLEPFGNQIGGGHGHPAQADGRSLFRSRPRILRPVFSSSNTLPEAGCVDVGRRHVHQSIDDGGDVGQGLLEFGVAGGFLGGELRDFLLRASGIGIEREILSRRGTSDSTRTSGT